jgi:hypothetical protein
MQPAPILLNACFVRPVHVVEDQIAISDAASVVDVDVGAGDVRVVVENRTDILIERTMRYQNSPPDARADVMGDVLYVSVQCPKLATQCGADHVIHLPKSADLLVETGSGNVDVDGLSASVDLDTGSGNIELFDIEGDIVASTGSGDVRGVGLHSASMQINTGSGNVDIALVDSADDLCIDTGSGDVAVQTPSGSYRIATDTGSGNVEVRGVTQSASASHRIDIGTGSGDIDIIGR